MAHHEMVYHEMVRHLAVLGLEEVRLVVVARHAAVLRAVQDRARAEGGARAAARVARRPRHLAGRLPGCVCIYNHLYTGFYSADFHDEKNVVFILEKTGFFIENKK